MTALAKPCAHPDPTKERMWRVVLRNSILALCVLSFIGAPLAFDISQKVLAQVEKKYGVEARQRLERWQQLMNTPKSLEESRKLLLVNSFFNQVKFVSDIEHWGQEDYWATPLEMLATDGGDCEDYAIAKYFTLRQMGVDDAKLRITYVKALRLNQAHMVLAYYPTPDADPLVLDNLINGILPASERTDLYPVYSFNGDGLWLSKLRGTGKRIGNVDKISQWGSMNERFLKQMNPDQ